MSSDRHRQEPSFSDESQEADFWRSSREATRFGRRNVPPAGALIFLERGCLEVGRSSRASCVLKNPAFVFAPLCERGS